MDDQVTLTAYADQIRDLIQHNRNDEAIMLCRHILHFYPKYIDAFRQMAEAYLEQHEYDAAQDLFRRVLSADPENTIAYIGLASIFEEKQLTDEAVWHMERAFELSPTHPEIHKELLRLHTVNSRKARPRLKLTPTALARLYAHQGLLAQATQELRAIVAGDPTRLDTRTALAEMLWRTGRIHEAAQVAQDLLGPLPYCLKANLILGTAWKESGLPESEAYLQRAQQLDPTNRVAATLLGARSPVLPAEPTVPRYVEGAPVPVPMPKPVITPPPFVAPTITPEPELVMDSTPVTIVESQPPLAPIEPSVISSESELPVTLGPSAKPELPITTLPPWLRGEGEPSDATDSLEMPPVKPSAVEDGTTLPQWISQPPESVAREPEDVLPSTWRETLITPSEEQTAVSGESLDWLTSLRRKHVDAETPTDETSFEPTPAEPTEPGSEETPTSDFELPDIFADTAPVEKPVEPARAETPTSDFELPAIFADTAQPQKPVEPTLAEIPTSEFELPDIFTDTTQTQIPVEPTLVETPTSELELPAIFANASPTEKPAEPTLAETPTTEFELPAIFADTAPVEKPVEPTLTETPTSEFELPDIFADTAPVGKPVEPTLAETPTSDFELPDIFADTAPVEKPVEPTLAETPTSDFPLPAIFADTAPVEKPVEPTLTETPTPQPSHTPVESVIRAETAPRARRQPKGYSHLELAREHRDASRWNDALGEYDWVIQHAPRFVNEVIVDVESLVRRAGVPLEAHRVLGDAYNRAGRLNDALERYRYLRERLEANP